MFFVFFSCCVLLRGVAFSLYVARCCVFICFCLLSCMLRASVRKLAVSTVQRRILFFLLLVVDFLLFFFNSRFQTSLQIYRHFLLIRNLIFSFSFCRTKSPLLELSTWELWKHSQFSKRPNVVSLTRTPAMSSWRPRSSWGGWSSQTPL